VSLEARGAICGVRRRRSAGTVTDRSVTPSLCRGLPRDDLLITRASRPRSLGRAFGLDQLFRTCPRQSSAMAPRLAMLENAARLDARLRPPIVLTTPATGPSERRGQGLPAGSSAGWR
jgi:hypothetical protein